MHQILVQILHLSLLHLPHKLLLIWVLLLLLLSHRSSCLLVELFQASPFFLVWSQLRLFVRGLFISLITHLFELELFGLLSHSVPVILSVIHCLGELLLHLEVGLVNLLVKCYLVLVAPIILELVLYYLGTLLYSLNDAIGLMPFISKQIIEDIVIHWSRGLESVEMRGCCISTRLRGRFSVRCSSRLTSEIQWWKL